MLFCSRLKKEEELTLREMYRYHPLSMTRIRAHCILLSNKHYQIEDIAKICDISRQAVSLAIHAWNNIGLSGLVDKHRSGRPKRLTQEQEIIVIEEVKNSPRSLKTVLNSLSQLHHIEISLDVLRRLCKSAKLSWKRVRKSLKSKRNQEEFETSKNLINQLVESVKKGEIHLRFFDEAGFSLVPSIPYAWQKLGEHIELPSSKSKSLNVLGCVSTECEFDSIVVEGSVTSDVLIHYFDEISARCNIDKPTVIVVDNAPTHTSHKFDKKTSEWCAKGLVVVPLSRYSPELNIIEIVWRKIKYEWMPFSAYESINSLTESLCDILGNIGEKFNIHFH